MPELRTRISLDSSQFQAGLRAAKGAAREFGSALAGAVSIGAVVAGLKSVISWADDMGDAAERVGMSVEKWQELAAAGQIAGISAEKLGVGISKMQASLAADKPTKEMIVSLAKLGLGFREVAAMTPEAQFDAIMHGLGGIASQGEKAQIAIGIFGKAGAKLIPLANDFDGLTKAARDFGLVLDAEVLKNVGRYNDLLDLAITKTKAWTAAKIDAIRETFVAAGADEDFYRNLMEGRGTPRPPDPDRRSTQRKAQEWFWGKGAMQDWDRVVKPLPLKPAYNPITAPPADTAAEKAQRNQVAADAAARKTAADKALAEQQYTADLETTEKKLRDIETAIQGGDKAAELFRKVYGEVVADVELVAENIGNGDVEVGLDRMTKRMQLFVKQAETAAKAADDLATNTKRVADAQEALGQAIADIANQTALQEMADQADYLRKVAGLAADEFERLGGKDVADAAGHLGETPSQRRNRKNELADKASFDAKVKRDAEGERVRWTRRDRERLNDARNAQIAAQQAGGNMLFKDASMADLSNAIRDAAQGREIVAAVDKVTEAVERLNNGLGPE